MAPACHRCLKGFSMKFTTHSLAAKITLSFRVLAIAGFLLYPSIPAFAIGLDDVTTTVLHCGTLLDVENKKTEKDISIVVKGERITKIGKDIAIPKGAKVLDLSDRICLPGLMDMHVHPLAHNRIELMYGKERSSAEYALVGARNVADMLYRGYTTLRIPGHPPDPGYALVDLKNAINAGILEGPRLFVAPHMLIPERWWSLEEKIKYIKVQYPDLTDEEANERAIEELASPRSRGAHIHGSFTDGPEGAREAVRRQIDHGADWIKIHLDSGGQLDSELTHNLLSDEEVHALVHETHRLNKRVAVGAHGDVAASTATLAGADSIEHGMYLSESTAQLMKKRGTYLVPTLALFNAYLFRFEQKDNPNVTLSAYERMATEGFAPYEARVRQDSNVRNARFKQAYKIGVNMANGSDQVDVLGALREFSYLVEQGVTHWDVLRMATINSADLLGMQDQIGSIRVGKYADIIAVPENPLKRIEALQTVNFVMKGGEVIRRQ